MEFNDIDPVGTEEEPRRPLRNHRLRRGIYILPSALTVANLLCGYYAVLATLGRPLCGFRQRSHRDWNRLRVRRNGWAYRALDGNGKRVWTRIRFSRRRGELWYCSGAPGLCLGRSSAGCRECFRFLAPYSTWLADGIFLCGLLRLETCAVQHSGNGARREQIFRGHADSCGGGNDCFDRAFARRVADFGCSLVDFVAGIAGWTRRFNVEFDAILQFQRYSMDAAAPFARCDSAGAGGRCSCEIFRTYLVCAHRWRTPRMGRSCSLYASFDTAPLRGPLKAWQAALQNRVVLRLWALPLCAAKN